MFSREALVYDIVYGRQLSIHSKLSFITFSIIIGELNASLAKLNPGDQKGLLEKSLRNQLNQVHEEIEKLNKESESVKDKNLASNASSNLQKPGKFIH